MKSLTGFRETNLMTGSSVIDTVVIYSNGSQECERMTQLLKTLPDVKEFLEYTVGNHFEQYQFEMEFGGDASYPQVSIDAKHIGSMKEALQYMKDTGLFT